MKKLVSLLMAACIPFAAFSGGFSIPEQGSRAASLGGAFTGLANDPSAIYFNPAGISFISGMQTMISTSIIIPKAQFQNADTKKISKMVDQTFVVPQGYFTMSWDYDLSFGFGIYAPYGLGTEWEKGWEGDLLSRKIDLKNIHFVGAVSYKVMDNWSVATSFAYSYSHATLIRKADQAGLGGDVNLEGTANGFHLVFGSLYKVNDMLSLGAVYKMASDLDIDGDIKFENAASPDAVAENVGTGKVTIPLPSQFNLGVAVNVVENLTITADYNWTEWSRYKELAIELPTETSVAKRNWNNTSTYRFGAEYSGLEMLTMRVGFILDSTPVTAGLAEPSLPDNDRMGYSFGAGYKLSDNMILDAYLLLLSWDEKYETNNEWGFNGHYNQRATLSGLSFTYKF